MRTLPETKRRVIAHIDMDAFFASIEQRDNPSYRRKPVIVGADPKRGKGRGVVSSCSYEARKFGVHSAQPISQAYKSCPKGIFLPVRMDLYQRVSRQIMEIFYRYTPETKKVSIDEAFLDLTESLHLLGSAHKIAREIKEVIKEETGLRASVGIAPNKIVAKIASGLNKPDGLVIVTDKKLLSFLDPLPVQKLWGVGEKVYRALAERGIETIGDLARQDPEALGKIFGKGAWQLWKLARGIDTEEVETLNEVKSLSKELTFEKDTADEEAIKEALFTLSQEVSRSLRKGCLKGKTITLKIRLEDFSTFTRAKTIKEPTNFPDVIYRYCRRLLDNFEKKGQKIRLVGVKVSGFVLSSEQLNFFTREQKKEKLYRAIDRIKDKFGEETIHLGGK
jgi:nucleotidyltransferase/DNA polymerase involved in DNA repair